MPTLFKTTALSLGLMAGIAIAAHAQTVSNTVVPGQSIANLPPLGPRASSSGYIPPDPQIPVVRSGNYPGPGAGAADGPVPPRFDKPVDWDRNVAMHPYTSDQGPKAH